MGLGLAYAAVPASLVEVVDAGSLETVVRPLPELRGRRAIALRALGEAVALSGSCDAVAIGPGIGTHHETQEFVRRFIARRTLPTVVDADGLNALAADKSPVKDDSQAPLVLTPHVGEMARLRGKDIAEVARDREAAAAECAQKFGCIVVMKGAPTFVADPSGDVYLNVTGNSGMATGGSGDVLTGAIVSLLAQGMSPLNAALCGVYLHGLAGDIAAQEFGERSLIASDIVMGLAYAIKTVTAVPDPPPIQQAP
jgi:NAD(P)H-hydrate epimerase